MVVLDKQSYISKAESLLKQNTTYRTLAAALTKKQIKRLIKILKSIKAESGLWDNTKGCILQEWSPQVLRVTQNLQDGHPLRPILSNRVQSCMRWPRNWPASLDH